MHCLRAYIFKSGVIDMTGIPHAEHEGFVIVPMSDKFFTSLGEPQLLTQTMCEKIVNFTEIETDYFGGFGEQNAKLYMDGKEVYVPEPDHPIDWALAKLGVVKKTGFDEFDTLELGRYRSSEDITNKWESENLKPSSKSGLEIERRFLLKDLPPTIRNRVFNGYRGKKIGQIYIEMPSGERSRLRRSFDGVSYTFYETKKTYVSPGVNQEDERVITEAEYSEKLQYSTRQISKTRYEHVDNDLMWEIDEFRTMVIAEIELPSMDFPLEIPEFLKDSIVMEVTGMEQFSNYNLASKT